MALKISTFSVDDGIIHVKGLHSLLNFCNYDPKNTSGTYTGLELAKDILDDKGASLYTADSVLTVSEIGTLSRLSEKFSDRFIMSIYLKPTPELIEYMRKSILDKLGKLIAHRAKYRLYEYFFQKNVDSLKKFLLKLFADDMFTLHVFNMKFIAENASANGAKPFYTFLMSVAMFSYGVAIHPDLEETLKFSEENLIDLMKAAFLFGYGALSVADTLIGLPLENRQEGFYDENKRSIDLLGSAGLNEDAMDAIVFTNEYADGVYDIITMVDKNTWMANIIIVTLLYAQEEIGLFMVKNKPSDILDHINVKSVEKKINPDIAQTFTLCLNLKNIFDFYVELENLRALCNKDFAVPYPMTGMGSPTMYICKKTDKTCQHLELGTKAVSLMQEVGELEKGTYHRCQLTTPKLNLFYKKHYKAIKKDGAE